MAGSYQSFEARLKDIGHSLDELMPDIIAVAIMGELESQYKNRIFDNGKDSTGQSIGEYSKEPGYYSKESFVRKGAFKGVGKPNKEGARRTKNKTMYIAGGYSEFRAIQGRQNNHVNLKLSGSMERAFKTMKVGNAAMFGNTDSDESKKIEGNEERYGAVFELDASEKQFLKDEIRDKAVLTIKGK